VSALTEAKHAWEPITPRGVAAFARASLERLLVVQSIVALLATAAIVWLLSSGFFPTVETAIGNLGEKGAISRGQLNIPDADNLPSKILAQGHFLAITLDVQDTRDIRLPAHFQIEFTKNSLVIISLLGEMEVPYPSDQSFYFNRRDVSPAWGAWSPNLLGLVAIGTFFGLLLTWTILATFYFLIVWVISFFSDRDLTFRASWKLAAAALLPGALILTSGIFLYGLGLFDLVQLGFAFTMHLIVSWIYLLISPMFLTRVARKEKKNPFTDKPAAS
jgi:Protein of unknown function (DUF1189)